MRLHKSANMKPGKTLTLEMGQHWSCKKTSLHLCIPDETYDPLRLSSYMVLTLKNTDITIIHSQSVNKGGFKFYESGLGSSDQLFFILIFNLGVMAVQLQFYSAHIIISPL